MRKLKLAMWVIASVICLSGAPVWGEAQAQTAEVASSKEAEPAAPKFENETCLACHGNEGFAAPSVDGKMRPLHVTKDKFGKSVHGKRLCVECHKDITEIPHQKGVHKVSCVTCHEGLWKTAQKEGKTREFARLGVVVQQIDRYMKSIHARPSREDQSYTNATCYDCHNAHYVYPGGSPGRAEWRQSLPNVCGKCHGKERDAYVTSVHGDEVIWKANPKAAVCSDCHTTHDIDKPAIDSIKLVITKNCGTCHQENLKTYLQTYHGQVSRLGYAYTAKCFDCHGNHGIQRVFDPKSTVHPDNRLKTCQKCHANATKGFVTFFPIEVPPLRERRDDIPALAFHFLNVFSEEVGKKVTELSEGAVNVLVNYDWPGNVRELENTIHRAVILATDKVIRRAHVANILDLSPRLALDVPRTGEELKQIKKVAREKSVETIEKLFVLEALKRNAWNVTKSAEETGMQRANFQALMKKYNIRIRDTEQNSDESEDG